MVVATRDINKAITKVVFVDFEIHKVDLNLTLQMGELMVSTHWLFPSHLTTMGLVGLLPHFWAFFPHRTRHEFISGLAGSRINAPTSCNNPLPGRIQYNKILGLQPSFWMFIIMKNMPMSQIKKMTSQLHCNV